MSAREGQSKSQTVLRLVNFFFRVFFFVEMTLQKKTTLRTHCRSPVVPHACAFAWMYMNVEVVKGV